MPIMQLTHLHSWEGSCWNVRVLFRRLSRRFSAILHLLRQLSQLHCLYTQVGSMVRVGPAIGHWYGLGLPICQTCLMCGFFDALGTAPPFHLMFPAMAPAGELGAELPGTVCGTFLVAPVIPRRGRGSGLWISWRAAAA